MRVRLILSLAALSSCTTPPDTQTPIARVVVRGGDSLPPAPRVTAFSAAATLIGVVVAVDSITYGWFVANVKGIAADDSSESRVTLDPRRLRDTAWLPAKPGTRYHVSAQLVTTTTPALASSWSDAAEITTTDAPVAPPRMPTRLAAAAASAYAIRLTWEDRSNDEYGFAVARAGADGRTFERVALLQPNTTSWTYSGLAPGESATFLIVSFNSAGASDPSSATTGATHRDISRANLIGRQWEQADSVAACLDPNVDLSRADDATDGDRPRVYRRISFGSHHVDMRVYLCGNANCNVALYAHFQGCKRKIGDLFFVPGDSISPGWNVRTTDRSGWPVLVTTSHSSYSSFGVATYQLIRGRYRTVDGYTHCGALRDVAWTGPSSDSSQDDADPRTVELRLLRPPFNQCQLDDPARR